MYTADWNSIKLSAAYTFTWMESAANSGFLRLGSAISTTGSDSRCFNDFNSLENDKLHQIGGSILHKPSGLGIFGQYTHESTGGEHDFFGPEQISMTISLTEVPPDQQSRDQHLVREALLAEGLGIYERGGARLPRRDHAVWRVWSI